MKKLNKPSLQKWKDFPPELILTQTYSLPLRQQHFSIPVPDLPSARAKLTSSEIPFRSFRNRKAKQELKYSKLMEKIESVPETIKKSEKLFRIKVQKSMKSLVQFNLEEQKEEKQVIDAFSNSVKVNMYTMSKPGLKFRKVNLRKQLKLVKN